MKVRDSGMPDRDYWETLIDVSLILDAFGFGTGTGNVAELGCGYGTFTLPLAQRITGKVFALDIEPEMVRFTEQRAMAAGLRNVQAEVRDVLSAGFGQKPDSCDAVLLFNILHAEMPVRILQAAQDVVKPGGLIAVIHWRSDIDTPRGPSLEIRPRPETIVNWAKEVGLRSRHPMFLLPPWHYGLALTK